MITVGTRPSLVSWRLCFTLHIAQVPCAPTRRRLLRILLEDQNCLPEWMLKASTAMQNYIFL
jgi:hypothetical protein